MAFTITAIDEAGGVLVSFDVDGKDQHISGLPVHDRAALTAALSEYEAAYVHGLELEAPPVVHDDVKALVGKPV